MENSKQSATYIIKDIKSAYKNFDGIRKEKKDLIEQFEKTLIAGNCKRILGFIPLLFIFGIVHVIFFIQGKRMQGYVIPYETLSYSLFVIGAVYTILIIRFLYGKRASDKTLTWIYRSFWIFYSIVVGSISYVQLAADRSPILSVFFLLSICIVPIFRIREVIWIAVGMGFLCGFISFNITFPKIYMDLYYSLVLAMIILSQIMHYMVSVLWLHQKKVELMAITDPLTGLLNRRGTLDKLSDMIEDLRDNDKKIGLIIMDIDYFKKYNDAFGHNKGDECLQCVSACIKRIASKRTNIVTRHGGEEFIVLVADTTEAEMEKLAKELCQGIYNLQIEAACKQVADVVTISAGVAVADMMKVFEYDRLVGRADEALYQAKANGKNQVVSV